MMLGGWTLRIGTRRATARAIQPVRRHTVATRPNPAGGVPGNRRSRAVEPPGNRENHCLTDIEGSRADDPGHRSGSALPIGKSSHIAYASSVAGSHLSPGRGHFAGCLKQALRRYPHHRGLSSEGAARDRRISGSACRLGRRAFVSLPTSAVVGGDQQFCSFRAGDPVGRGGRVLVAQHVSAKHAETGSRPLVV